MSNKRGNKDLKSNNKGIQAVHISTNKVKRDSTEELYKSYKLLKAWKIWNEDPEHGIPCEECWRYKKKPNLIKTEARKWLC